MSSINADVPATTMLPPARKPVPKWIVAVVAVICGLVFLWSLLMVLLANQFASGTSLFIDKGQPARLGVAPGVYSLIAEQNLQSSIKPSASTLPEITCLGTEADGTTIVIKPHFQNYSPRLLQGLWSTWSYSYRVADLTITQPNPTLTCSGDWYALTLAPRLTANLQGAAFGLMVILLIGGVAAGVFAIIRSRRPGFARRLANGCWFGILGVAIIASVGYRYLPLTVNSSSSDRPTPVVLDCPTDNPVVVGGDSVTGLSFNKAYLIDAIGLTVCLSSPQPYYVPVNVPIPDGEPMVLQITSELVHGPQPSVPVSQLNLEGTPLVRIDATSGGEPVAGLMVFDFVKASDQRYYSIGTISSPFSMADNRVRHDIGYAAYAAVDPSDLNVTLTFKLSNVYDWSVTANFQLNG